MQNAQKTVNIYSQVKSDIKVFSNIACILEKIEQDGNFIALSSVFNQIFNTEVIYAVNGELSRVEEIKG